MWTEEKLNQLLTSPSDALVEDMKKIGGDIMVLGAGGKMGPTLCLLAKNAAVQAGKNQKIYAVSRFSDRESRKLLQKGGVTTIAANLQNLEELRALPEIKNIIFMAGKKFGTDGAECQTWGMNSVLPVFVAERFKASRIVAFSTGNIYPIVPLSTGGCTERDRPGPVGEYAMSCLARERTFEYYSERNNTPVFLFRLNFSIALRYGVLCDIAQKILSETPISVATPCFNCIWQGTANEIAIRALLHAVSPAVKMNVTGPETASVREVANRLGALLGKKPVFEGAEGTDAYLNNAMDCMETFGYPSVPLGTMIRWQAERIRDGGKILLKPTHFEERKGSY